MSREVVLVSDQQVVKEESSKDDDHMDLADDTSEITRTCEDFEDKATEEAAAQNRSATQNEYSIPFADDEEDVPADFFDDFSNQDFMAGLDIIDVWDEEELNGKGKKNKVNDNRDLSRRDNYARSDSKRGRPRYSRSPLRRRRNSIGRSYTRRSRNRVDSRRSKDAKKSIPKDKEPKEGDEVALDHRRDPEKTKRDIQKDKDKCAKNKEAKIISEKLKVVETGLVPPGMEMEVDLINPATSAKEPEKKPPSVRENTERHRRSRSKNADKVRSRYSGRENAYGSLRHSRSPRIVQRRSRTPRRRRSRSPYYRGRERERRRVSSERKTYEERNRIERYRKSSPVRRKSREPPLDLSPVSNISDREMWLRHRGRQRKLSCSPISDIDSFSRKRSQNFLEELAHKLESDKKKKLYFKEVQERLNEPTHFESNYSVNPIPVPPPMSGLHNVHSVPEPGFVPGQFFPHADPQYDEHYFTGQSGLFNNSNAYADPYLGPGYQPAIPGISDSVIAPHPKPLSFNGNNRNNIDLLNSGMTTQKEKDQETIAKLFEDKKISLSDFLRMSAQDKDPSKPVNMQKKIKVISISQDAIKALGAESNLMGRFFPKKTVKDTEKKEEPKFQSPLRKIPIVRFSFTTPAKRGEDKSTLQGVSSKLLASLGLTEASRSASPKLLWPLSPVSSETSIKSIPPQNKAAPAKYEPLLGARFQMKMCQTEPVKCNACEIRKARKFVHQSIQCSLDTVDTATQITEDDMQRFGVRVAIKDAFKNQSLAHLTPAQILAAQSGGREDSPKKDNFSSRMITPPILDKSPEKQNMRGLLSSNDRFHSQGNNINRPGGPNMFNSKFTPPSSSFENSSAQSLLDRSVPRPSFDNRAHIMHQIQQHNDNRLRNVNQRMVEDGFDYEQPANNYGDGANQRPFLLKTPEGNQPRPYGGRKFF